MVDAIGKRMAALQARFDAVLRDASECDARAKALKNELLRIEGAMAVLRDIGSETEKAEAETAEATNAEAQDAPASTGDES